MSDCSAHTSCGGESNSGEPAICFEGVSFSYGGSLVVEDADFDIYKGESVCVVGPNGGGKSTLLKLMLGLLQPDQGRVHLLGDTPKRARARVGYVPQHIDFDPLFPVTVLDVVLMGRLERSTFGFANRRDTSRALEAAEVDVLLLDEPTAHVDVAAEERLLKSLKALKEDLTLVTVSHDLAFVSRSVPKVVCVNRCVHVHPTTELTDDRLRQLYGFEVRMVQHDHEHLDSHGGHDHS